MKFKKIIVSSPDWDGDFEARMFSLDSGCVWTPNGLTTKNYSIIKIEYEE